ncbi:MAG: ABC transporter substrate-binding protein [Candidatus Thorarchaeota archaeon]|nr:ABC transporter substrate-binding protein [Candidatus Thorarchaeota archaeon]
MVIVIIAIAGVGIWYATQMPAQAKDTLIMGTTDSVEVNLDNARSYDYFGWEIITALSSGLVEIKPGSSAGPNDIQPALAESWEQSSDGLTWTFTLRQGVTFDGARPFNASVVKYTFDRNCNLTGNGLWEPDGPQLNIGYDSIISSVEVVSTYVVAFHLKMKFAPFLQLMSCAASYMVDPKYAPMDQLVNYKSGDARASHPLGLGPYILTNWTRTGSHDSEMRLEANPYYWNKDAGLPKTKTIIIKMFSDSTALGTAISSGQIDIAYRQLTAAQVNSFKNNAKLRVWEGIGAQIQYMCFQQRIAPFNNTEVRRAIAAALNRTHVTETVFLNMASPLYSIIPAGMAYHKDSFKIYGDANYSYTQTTLAKYGYTSSHKLVVDLWYESSGHYPESAKQAAVYKSDLEASGVIEVNLHSAEWGTYAANRRAGTMAVYIYGWYPDYIDADNYAFLPFASWINMGYNSTYPAGGVQQYNLWMQGRSAATDAARQDAYYQLQDLQAQECSVIPLWQSQTTAVTSTSVHGVVLDITVNWRHWLLYWGAPATTGP